MGSVRERNERQYLANLYSAAAAKHVKTPEQIAQERQTRLAQAAEQIRQQELDLFFAQRQMSSDEQDVARRRISDTDVPVSMIYA